MKFETMDYADGEADGQTDGMTMSQTFVVRVFYWHCKYCAATELPMFLCVKKWRQ